MSRRTIERTQASPGNEISQARSSPSEPAGQADQPPFEDEDNLELPVRRADGLHDANLAAAFEDAHQHRVGDPERRHEQGHRGHARHPAEDEQVGQPLALDVLDDRPAPHAEGFDFVHDLLDVLGKSSIKRTALGEPPARERPGHVGSGQPPSAGGGSGPCRRGTGSRRLSSHHRSTRGRSRRRGSRQRRRPSRPSSIPAGSAFAQGRDLFGSQAESVECVRGFARRVGGGPSARPGRRPSTGPENETSKLGPSSRPRISTRRGLPMTWSRSESSTRPIRCANISEIRTDRSSSDSNGRPTTTPLAELGLLAGAGGEARVLGPVAEGSRRPARRRSGPGAGRGGIRASVSSRPGVRLISSPWASPCRDCRARTLRIRSRRPGDIRPATFTSSAAPASIARQPGTTVTFRATSPPARLALDRPLHPLVDRQARGEHERPEDDAQGRQAGAQLLPAERGQGETEQVDPAHGTVLHPIPIRRHPPRSARRPVGRPGRCNSRPVPRRG